MICEPKISTQLNSEGLAEVLDPKERERLLAAMVRLGDALRKLRIKKLSRDSHQRRYKKWGYIDRLKVKSFRESPRGREYYAQYNRERRKRPEYHFRNWLYGSINRAIKKGCGFKRSRTVALVGCSLKDLMKHLESKFVNGMSWERRSEWHVDHFVPLSAFELTDPLEQQWAFNWRNLRPLPAKENQSKSNTLPDPLPSWLPHHIAERIIYRYAI